MERNPLYFNTDLGGLVPITNPDLINTNLIDWQTNSTTNLTIPLTNPALASLEVTPEEILFRAITYDAQAELYVYATEETALSTIGIVVDVTATSLIVQFCGVIRNTSFPDGNWYLSTADNGELINQPNRILLVANNVIVKQVEEQMVNQAVITGGITVTSGHNVAATVGTKINIGNGASNISQTYTTQTQLATIPSNSTTEKHLYIKGDLITELLDKPYLVVTNEVNEDVKSQVGTMDATSVVSGFITTVGTPPSPLLSMRATTTGTWVMGHFNNNIRPSTRLSYYEISYVGGTSNTQIGLITLDYTKALPASGIALSSNTANQRFSDCIHISMQTASSGFVKLSNGTSWNVLFSTAQSHTAGTKLHGILIDHYLKQVYWSINGTWLNSGGAIATYTGTKQVVPAVALANNTSFVSTTTPTAAPNTFPAGVLVPYVYYNKAANQSYEYNYAVNPPVPVYSSRLYLGSVTSDSTTATITNLPPNNNTYTEEVYLSELITIDHKLQATVPSISFNAETGITYSVATPNTSTLTISASADPVNNTIVTVSC